MSSVGSSYISQLGLAEMRPWATLVRVTATGMTGLPPVSHVVVAKGLETQAWRSSAPALSFTSLLLPPMADATTATTSRPRRNLRYAAAAG